MTTATMTATTAAASGANTGFADTLRALWETVKYEKHQRDAVRQLRALPDHRLRDVGVHRSEITSIVYNTDPARARHYQF